LKEEIQMANKYRKKCSTSETHKGNANQMTLRFYLTLVKVAVIRKQQMLVRMCGGGRGTLIYY
jgi:hypothetical protein